MSIAIAEAPTRPPAVHSRAWARGGGLLAAIGLLVAVAGCSLA